MCSLTNLDKIYTRNTSLILVSWILFNVVQFCIAKSMKTGSCFCLQRRTFEGSKTRIDIPVVFYAFFQKVKTKMFLFIKDELLKVQTQEWPVTTPLK